MEPPALLPGRASVQVDGAPQTPPRHKKPRETHWRLNNNGYDWACASAWRGVIVLGLLVSGVLAAAPIFGLPF